MLIQPKKNCTNQYFYYLPVVGNAIKINGNSMQSVVLVCAYNAVFLITNEENLWVSLN